MGYQSLLAQAFGPAPGLPHMVRTTHAGQPIPPKSHPSTTRWQFCRGSRSGLRSRPEVVNLISGIAKRRRQGVSVGQKPQMNS